MANAIPNAKDVYRQDRNVQESSLRQVLERAGEAPFLSGNKVTLLQDGPDAFEAWIRAIREAKRFVLLENYIIRDDRAGRLFLEVLLEKAKQGVQVFVIFDWLGSFGTSPRFLQPLVECGGHVRMFNPWRWEHPLGVVQRDHSKLLCIDGEIGFIGGICIGEVWLGIPKRQQLPWRDTAVQVEGVAAIHMAQAFDAVWSACGPPLPASIWEKSRVLQPGGALVQVVRGAPWRSLVYRQIQTLFSAAAEKIWITDAYFVLPPYLYESIVAAARAGVDVRILGPRHSDIGYVTWLSRSGYGALLDAGVRIFEWEGTMLHAKTMVVDGRWSKVGSSNMNAASLLTSWEKDVLIEDFTFATKMERMFLADLGNASELVLASKKKPFGVIHRIDQRPDKTMRDRLKDWQQYRMQKKAFLTRIGAGLLALALRRPFQRDGWSTSAMFGIFVGCLAVLFYFYPWYVACTMAAALAWWSVGLLLQSLDRWRKKHPWKGASSAQAP